MRKIAAIAWLTIRTAIHSRVLASLLALVLLTVCGLPLIIKADGTLAGRVHILLQYTLGMLFFLMSLATAWTACGAISLELSNRRLFLALTKPLHRYQLWLGKWLGVVIMNGILLLLGGAIIYGMLCWTQRPAVLSAEDRRVLAEDILVAQQMVLPVPDNVTTAVAQRLQTLRETKQIPADQSEDQIRAELTRELQRRANLIRPGESKTWTLTPPSGAWHGEKLLLRFQFWSSRMEQIPVRGAWYFGPPGTAMTATGLTERTFQPEIPSSVPIPSAAVQPDGTVFVTFINRQENPPITVLFAPDGGLRLAIQHRDFEANYLRALVILLCQLAFLAAIGLTMGCLFSMPTAVFVTGFALLLLFSGGTIASLATTEDLWLPQETPADAFHAFAPVAQNILAGLNAILRPLQEFDAVHRIGESELIPWTQAGHALWLYLGVYTLVTAWIGIGLFTRRELGLTGQHGS